MECPLRAQGGGWFSGGSLRVEAMDGAARDALGAALEEAGLAAAALACGENVLASDADHPQAALEHLARVVETAATLGVPVVCLRVGRVPSASLGDSIAEFARRIQPLAKQAEGAGVRLAVENDPHCGEAVEDQPANAAFAPELWEKLFTHIRSEAVGLALDPAPLVWLGVDPIAAATDYAEKVFHFRARDTEVFEARRQDCSVLRPGGGWWRYRLPGLGEIDWRRMLDRLMELSYDGAVAVAHDDPVWGGSDQRVKAGLALARRHLAQWLP
jgi:sugar phosphate isomerase/epimerase